MLRLALPDKSQIRRQLVPPWQVVKIEGGFAVVNANGFRLATYTLAKKK